VVRGKICYEAQVLRIMLHVNKRRKLRTLILINPLVNPNIHELKYCDKHFDQPNFSDLGSSIPGFLQTSKGTKYGNQKSEIIRMQPLPTVSFQVQMSNVLQKQQHGGSQIRDNPHAS